MSPTPERLHKFALAKKLGISRPTLDKYLALDKAPQPDANETYDVAEVARHIAEHATKIAEPDEIKKLRARKLLAECKRIEHEYEVSASNYIHHDEIRKTLEPLMAELAALLTSKFENQLPSQYRGRSLAECQQLNAAAIDFIIQRFKTGTDRLVAQ